jgi:hypothetical protein
VSLIITQRKFLEGYMRELRKADKSVWADTKARTKFVTAAAQIAIKEAKLESGLPVDPQPGESGLRDGLTTTKEYFRIDVIGDEKVGDRDCNWMLRVAFEHENPGWHAPDTRWGAPNRRPYWIQELCKLTHLFADLRVLAAYHDPNRDGDLTQLLQRNVDRMEEYESRMTRVPKGKWLFIFGPKPPAIAPFRAFTLAGDTGTTVAELKMPL